MPKEQIKNIAIIVLAVAVVAMGYYTVYGSPMNLSGSQASTKAIAYINAKVLSGGDQASLDGKVLTESGLYKINIKVGADTFPSYVSKDGKLLFPQVIQIEDVSSSQANNSTPVDPAQACLNLAPQKSDAPALEAFVVSQCPYGLQMQRILVAIAKNTPELANDIKIKYIGSVEGGKITSMHGDEEAQENLRQICIREEQSAKFFAYLECYLKEGKSDSCLTAVGVDQNGLKTCMAGKGLEYAQEDFSLASQYNIQGSPTLILNGNPASEFDFGGRSAQAVKELICCGYNSPISACATVLSTEQANTSFSADYSGGSSSGGSCN
ncbi:MAG: hypothetical protein PHE77_02155 [Candidatus Pacebacteria bacterium]|nr:hypothetical protein [Candidatus Paceibacterota bacterium]